MPLRCKGLLGMKAKTLQGTRNPILFKRLGRGVNRQTYQLLLRKKKKVIKTEMLRLKSRSRL